MSGCFYMLMATYTFHILSQNDQLIKLEPNNICKKLELNYRINIFETNIEPPIKFVKYIRAYENGPFVNLGQRRNNLSHPFYSINTLNEDKLIFKSGKYDNTNCIIKRVTINGSEFHDCAVGVMNTCFEDGRFYGLALQTTIANLKLLLDGQVPMVTSEKELSEDNIKPSNGDERLTFNSFDDEDNETNSIKNFTEKISNLCECKLKPTMDIYLNISNSTNKPQNELTKFCSEFESKNDLEYNIQFVADSMFILNTKVQGASCYTDSADFFPIEMEIHDKSEDSGMIRYTYTLEGDGYYWCTLPWLSMKVLRTEKYLYIKNNESLKRRWAIMVKTNHDTISALQGVNPFGKIHTKAILSESRNEGIFRQMNITIESIQLKRAFFTDEAKLLFHVSLTSDIFLNKEHFSEDVLYVRNLWGCNTSILDANENKTIPINNKTCVQIKDKCVKCIGDFNMGSHWDTKSQVIADTVYLQESTLIDSSTTPEVSSSLPYPSINDQPPQSSFTNQREVELSIHTSTYTKVSEASLSNYVTYSTIQDWLPKSSSTIKGDRRLHINTSTSTISSEDTKLMNYPLEKTAVVQLTLDILRKPTLNEADVTNVIDNVENLMLFSNDSITSSIPMDIENAINNIDLSTVGGRLEMMRDSIGLAVFESAQFSYKTIKCGRAINNSLSFNYFNEELNSSSGNEEDAQVLIDMAHISKYKGRVALTYYENDTLFRDVQDKVHKVNSPIVSMSIAGVGVLHGNDSIQIHFRPRENVLTTSQIKVCAYWDNNTWSSKGCKLISNSSNPGLETCRCNHLSHFALLVKLNRNPIGELDQRIVTVLTYLGSALSSFGIMAICLTGVLFKKWRKEFSNKIWINLSVAIGIQNITFIINNFLYRKRINSDICILLGSSLHYSVLVTFCWMLMSALLAYKKLVEVFNKHTSNRILKLSLVGWLVPIIPVALLLIIKRESYYGSLEEFESYKEFCYPSGLGFKITVLCPIIFILTINAIIFVAIIKAMFFNKGVRYHGNKNDMQNRVSACFLLFIMFGISRVFGLMGHLVVFYYIFYITSSLQGFILFLFLIVANKKTRSLWLPKKKMLRDIEMTSTDTLLL